MASAIVEALLRFFYPGACPACLGPSEDDRLCNGCSRMVPLLGALAPPGVLAGRPVLAACLYAGVVRDLLLHLKFARESHPATALGEILAERLAASAFARDADAIVPMPLSRRRLRERGFNQSERIASVVSKRIGIPTIERLLVRPVHRPPQADLGPADRARNVRGVFRGRDGAFGRSILLLDDVITTGHTVAEASAALEAAGARTVRVCAVAASGWDARGASEVLIRSGSGARETPSRPDPADA